jgi:hypothetical protein
MFFCLRFVSIGGIFEGLGGLQTSNCQGKTRFLKSSLTEIRLYIRFFSKISKKLECLLNNASIFCDLYQSHLGMETKRRHKFVAMPSLRHSSATAISL